MIFPTILLLITFSSENYVKSNDLFNNSYFSKGNKVKEFFKYSYFSKSGSILES